MTREEISTEQTAMQKFLLHEEKDEQDPNSTEEKKSEGEEFNMAKSLTTEALRPFVIISTSYLLFTITDGAIRMIVLLQAYTDGFSALEVAIMFTLYEVAGAITNLAAGWMGAKWGIKLTLIYGLLLQLFSYGLLFLWDPEWDKATAIVFVTISQMFAGIAKDLTKLGGKIVTKLVTPEEQDTRLYQLVALITGFKNSLKGIGYFLGSYLITIKYELALEVMMVLVALAIPWALFGLDSSLGRAKKDIPTLKQLISIDNHNLNILSLARLFLFASRDFWFEVPLPFYLRSPPCQGLGETICSVDSDCFSGAICGENGICVNQNVGGGCGGVGLSRVVVGAFLGGYIILYGQVQSWTPQLVTDPLKQTPPNKYTEILWGMVNCIPTALMAYILSEAPAFENHDTAAMIWILVWSVIIFAIIFAINSSIHSFLVVKYAKSDDVAISVGFYYMCNSIGRLLGTIGSGLLFTYVGEYQGDAAGNDGTAGFVACFVAGTVCSLLAAFITYFIDDEDEGLLCGSCVCIEPKNEDGLQERLVV